MRARHVRRSKRNSDAFLRLIRLSADAKIEAQQLDEYPVHVDIVYGDEVVWTAPQRDLFRKYPDKRAKSQQAIEQALRKLG